MSKYVRALHQVTTSSRAILYDHEGNTCAAANREFKQYYPQPGPRQELYAGWQRSVERAKGWANP